MSKFGKLIQNEWRKQLHKVSVWVLLLILLFSAIGYAFLNSMDDFSYEPTDSSDDYLRSQIQYYQELLKEPNRGDEERLYYEKQVELYQLLLELRLPSDDWRIRRELAETAVDAKYNGDTKRYEELVRILRENDLVGYYRLLSAEAGSIAGTDTELARILTDFYDYCIEHEIVPDQSDWRYTVAMQMVSDRRTVLLQERLRDAGKKWDEEAWMEAVNRLAVLEYRLEHELPVNPADSFTKGGSGMMGIADSIYGAGTSGGKFWDSMAQASSVMSLICLISIIFAGSVVANEFSAGTIKFLLVSPVTRKKILFSKYVCMLLLLLLMVGILFVGSLIGSLPGGASQVFTPAVTAQEGEVHLTSPFLLLFQKYLLSGVEVLVIMTLAFAISSLFRNSALAIGISLFGYFAGGLCVSILYMLGLDWVRYLLFANLDFSAIAAGTTGIAHQSLPVAIVVVVLHMIVFLLTAMDAFDNREV